jgi:hypothetical protein
MASDESQAYDSLAALLLAIPHADSGVLADSRRTIQPPPRLHPIMPADTIQKAASRSSSHVEMMSGLAKGAKVVVYGEGPMQCLAARLAAIQGFETTLIIKGESLDEAEELCYDESYAMGSIPLAFVPISGENADEGVLNRTVKEADGIIVTFDRAEEIMSQKGLNILMPPNSDVKHISIMSRNLNGEGMGFWNNAARATSNPDVWTAPEAMVQQYREMEAFVKERAAECGASFTIVRVGTLKGGSTGGSGDGGEPSFLNGRFYDLGSQDVVNWRLLYDNQGLGFELVKGDTLSGPGIRAVWDSRDKVAEGDSHRGAAAAALVEAMRTPAAQNADFAVKTIEGRKFPTPEEIASLYEKA